MGVKSFLDFVRSTHLNETSMSSDWDADYGLSQGPIDSDTRLNIDLAPGMYVAEPSEYDFSTEEEDDPEDLMEPESKKKSLKHKFSEIKSMLRDLESRILSLENAIR